MDCTFRGKTNICGAVLSLLKDELNITLSHSDIVAAQQQYQPDRLQSLFVNFLRYCYKQEFIHARGKLKGSDVTIFEDMTKKKSCY